MNPKNIGQYRFYNFCRFCLSNKIKPVINLGMMPLAGGFLKKNDKETIESEKFYPLELIFCKDCYLLQTNCVVDRATLFKKYFYHSSSIQTLVDFFEENINYIKKNYQQPSKTFIVEIGCNDGHFIKSLIRNKYKTIGVDPAENIVKPLIQQGLPIVNGFFSEKLAKKIVKKYGRTDAIYSFNTFAHIEDMHDVLRGVKILLKEQGILVFQTHYVGSIITTNQYDMIYHEHQYYYSLLTIEKLLARFDMEVFDAKIVNLHGGSIIFYAQNKKHGKNNTTKNVKKLALKEKKDGFNKSETFLVLSKKIIRQKTNLVNLLKKLKSKNKIIVGYGASGRSTILMNYCEIDNKLLSFMVDDAPSKQGKFTPGTHLKIYPSSKLHNAKKPDYILLFAWSFFDEIRKKNIQTLRKEVRFIIPLPKVQIVNI